MTDILKALTARAARINFLYRAQNSVQKNDPDGELHLRSIAEITTLRKELAEARAALEDSQKLINRIMHVHVAPDECTGYVEDSRAWFSSNGGTLGCIAEQNERNQAVLRPPSNAKGEKK